MCVSLIGGMEVESFQQESEDRTIVAPGASVTKALSANWGGASLGSLNLICN